jgi:uncharacterized protein
VLEAISTLVVYAIVLGCAFGLAYWAYRARADRSALVGLYLLFGFPGGLLAVAGLALTGDGRDLGPVLLAVGLGMALPLLAPVRRAIAAVTPVDPESAVDMTGLCVVLPVVAGLFVAGAIDPDAPEAGDVESVGAFDLLAQAALEVGLAFAAVGWLIVRRLPEATERLGIRVPTGRTIAAALGFFVAVLFAYGAVATAAELIDPGVFEELEPVTEDLTEDVQNPVGAALVGISAGAGEEAVFRGAMQPRFGIPLTSLAFAVIHAPQYGFSPIILALFAVSVLLGLERRRFGTTAAMITHALYNFLAVMVQASQ